MEEFEITADAVTGVWSVKFTVIEAHLGEHVYAFQEDGEGNRTADPNIAYWAP